MEVRVVVDEPGSVTTATQQQQQKEAASCVLDDYDDAVSAAENDDLLVCRLRVDALRVGSNFAPDGSHGF